MPEQKSLHLPDKYLAQVKSLLRQHIPQADVWAYGSRVRGDFHDASDLDLVARFPASVKNDIFRLSALQEAFTESDLPIIVQIVDWDGIPESFKDEIVSEYFAVQENAA